MGEVVSAELPLYQCHKRVRAVKIADIRIVDGIRVIIPEEHGHDPVAVTNEYVDKHEPKVGGYYVLYSNGHQSYSPGNAFEEGYTKLSAEKSEPAEMVSVPRKLLRRLTTWRSCMSYNDSYFGEEAGELKRITADLDRLI